MSYEIINASVLDADPGDGFDGCLCDPPYGYSKPPTAEQMVEILQNWIAGKDAEYSGGGFMGKTWDSFVPGPATWRKVYAAMKPGAHLMAFGGPRTSDLLGISLRLAGFEIRDTLMFLYGAGFPKSHSISKAIDKAAGAEREIVGASEWSSAKMDAGKGVSGLRQSGSFAGEYGGERVNVPLTAPATPDAIRWDGYGTALKPAYEGICLARKPIDGTIAHNAVTHGCGGLNIEGGRIGYEVGGSIASNPLKRVSSGHILRGADGLFRKGGETRDISDRVKASGRWPSNLILSHHHECVPVGTKRVKGDARQGGGSRPGGFGDIGAESGGDQPCAPGHADADGYETVDAWRCHKDCPVNLIDQQSGERAVSGAAKQGHAVNPGRSAGGQNATWELPGYGTALHNDTGGASRFFYTAKASAAERSAGLDGRDPCNVNDGRQTSIDNPYQRGDTPRRNTHPTVKPIDLCRYLATLLLPPPRDTDRRILVPFSGSGSEMIGAHLAGWEHVVGIEIDAEYCEIAEARLKHWTRQGEMFAAEGKQGALL